MIRRTVELRDRFHLFRGQFPGDGAHLLINVVSADVLRKRCQLALDIGGVLTRQRWRSDLIASGSVTGSARSDAALLVTSKHQACTGAALPKTAAAFRNAHTRIRLKSSPPAPK